MRKMLLDGSGNETGTSLSEADGLPELLQAGERMGIWPALTLIKDYPEKGGRKG